MWRRFGLGLALLLAAASAKAQETDDFDSVEEEATVAATPASIPQRPSASQVAQSLIPFQDPESFYMEVASWGLGVLFFVVYFLGKWQNARIANKWVEEAEPLLRAQFAYTASSPERAVGLVEENKNNFKYYCTGRRFCTRFLADIELNARQDIFSRAFRIVVPKPDYLTIDIGLSHADVDPFILSISKKLGFTALSKVFPELIETAKQVPVKEVPDSMWVSTDCTEIPKVALTNSLQASLKELEDFLECIVITDMNKLPIVGMPKTEKHILRVQFKMYSGSKKLDTIKSLELVFFLIDAIGSSIKLSSNAKHTANKRRLKIKQAEEAIAAKEDESALRLQELREKKQQKYESLSYDEQQKIDTQNQKKMARKRQGRKKM